MTIIITKEEVEQAIKDYLKYTLDSEYIENMEVEETFIPEVPYQVVIKEEE